jgi:ubiquinone/menaquinone biosynthesis C-methylase UbiE
MDDPLKAEAFMASGREDGVLAFLYLFHSLQAAPVINAGDRVLDLACGPANQLMQMARLNPRAYFVGLDASASMLERAGATMARNNVRNVQLVQGDIRKLENFAQDSFDCVLCTMSLHHLPDVPSLQRAMTEAGRVLKPDGGAYIADFGRLRRRRTQQFFAHDNSAYQLPEFTEDYLNSLQAAFSFEELADAIALLGIDAAIHRTVLAPFMIIAKSKARRDLDEITRAEMKKIYARMTADQQKNFVVLSRWFRAAGLELPCELC